MQYPQYEPCNYAHTPQKLSRCSAWKLANIIIDSAVPIQFQIKSLLEERGNYSTNDSDSHPSFNSYSLDTILWADEMSSPHEQNLHSVFKNRLIRVKNWWDTSEWLGNIHESITAARQDLQDAISDILDHKFMHIRCPLMRYTLQLIFTNEAGSYSNIVPHGYYEVELSKKGCRQYSIFLGEVGIFSIRRLVNKFTLFAAATPEPLVVILKNSPNLKEFYLRHNSSDYLINFLRLHCPLIEKITIEEVYGKLLVTLDGLYKTFFCGLSQNEVCERIKSKTDIKISFPHLTHLDIGKSNNIKLFLCHLQYCYPKVVSLSWSSSNFLASYFLNHGNIINKINIPVYNIQEICFGSNCLLSLDRKIIWKTLPFIKHITLGMDELHQSSDLPSLIAKTKEFLTFSRFTSLTIHIPFLSLSNLEIEDVLLPIFNLMSPNIKALQFYIQRNMNCDILWKLINACTNLELLALKLFEAHLLHTKGTRLALNPLDDLKSLAINCEELELELYPLLDIFKEIIISSKYLRIVEFRLPVDSRDWVMDISARGFLKNITILSIHFDFGSNFDYSYVSKDVDIDFYVPVVEALTNLRKLILVKLYTGILADMKKIFRTSQLRVFSGPESIVGYYGVSSRYTM